METGRKRPPPGEKVVARSVRNSEYQRLKNGDLAILFFRESCPYCKDFKPTWNRIARELKGRWFNGTSVVYDDSDEESGDVKLVGPPEVVKLDVTKFPAVKNYIQFPTVPCVALYKRGKPVVFFTGKDRSLPNVLKAIENYYKRATLPANKEDYVVGTESGTWPPQLQQENRDKEKSDDDNEKEEKSDDKEEESPNDDEEAELAEWHWQETERRQREMQQPRKPSSFKPIRKEMSYSAPPPAAPTLGKGASISAPIARGAVRPPSVVAASTVAPRAMSGAFARSSAVAVNTRIAEQPAAVNKVVAEDEILSRFLALLLKRRGELQ